MLPDRDEYIYGLDRADAEYAHDYERNGDRALPHPLLTQERRAEIRRTLDRYRRLRSATMGLVG